MFDDPVKRFIFGKHFLMVASALCRVSSLDEGTHLGMHSWLFSILKAHFKESPPRYQKINVFLLLWHWPMNPALFFSLPLFYIFRRILGLPSLILDFLPLFRDFSYQVDAGILAGWHNVILILINQHSYQLFSDKSLPNHQPSLLLNYGNDISLIYPMTGLADDVVK